MFITNEKHHKTQFLANMSCDEKSICIPLPNKIYNSAMSYPKVKYLQGCAHTKSLRVATQHWYVTGNLAFSAVVANCNNAL